MRDFLKADLRDAVRGFLRHPGFFVAAVVSLGLGIGANTAIFSVANALILRPLPYASADRLVILWNRSPGIGITEDWFSSGQYFDVKRSIGSFDEVALVYGANENLAGDGGEPQRIGTLRVSSNFFAMLGVSPAAGRLFNPEEDTATPATTAVLGYATWVRRYGADPGVIGRRIDLNARSYQIVGVLPASFSLPHEVVPTLGNAADAEIVIPFPQGPNAPQVRNREDYNIVARLKPGATIAQAQQELDTLTARLRQDFPNYYPPNGGLTFAALPLQEQVVGAVRRPLGLLTGAVLCVLLIACANVANLLLSRALGRRKEIAIRAAIGAGRGRIVRQLLTESLLIAVTGGILGLIFAVGGLQALQALGSKSVPRLREIRIDTVVLLYTFGLSLVSAVIFGLAPALRSANPDLQVELKDDNGAQAGLALFSRATRQRTRKALVVAELALAVVLLVAAGLLIRSFAQLQQVPRGFRSDGVLTMELSMSQRKYAAVPKMLETVREMWVRLGRIPGVVAVGSVSSLPLSNMMAWGPITVEGRAVAANERFINVDQRVISGEYLEAMEIPLLQGRLFSREDTADTPRVGIVDQQMAQTLWPAGDALGKRVRTGGIDANAAAPWITIVGVVGNVKQDALDADSRMALYFPHSQLPGRAVNVVVRAQGDAAAIATAVRKELRELDPDLPVHNVRTMAQRVSESLARRRFSMLLFAIFAALASGLAAVGVYGVIAFLVTQGTKEMGIRMALGATPGEIGMLVVRHGLVMAAFAIAIGMGAALVITRIMGSLLFGIGASDPITYGIVCLLVAVTALAASYIPARRAARLDPMRSLR